VALVLLGPSFDGVALMSILDLTTLQGHAVLAMSLESQVIFHRLKETGDLFLR
jgi:hypothetical protein